MSTSAISLSTTAPKQTAAAPEKTGIFESIKSIFKRGAAAAPAQLTPERVTPDPVVAENLENFLLVCELSKKGNLEIFDILTQVIHNKINSRDILEIKRAIILNDYLDVGSSMNLEIHAKERLILALLDTKYSPKEAAKLTLQAFEGNYLNKKEVEKIAIALGKRAVAKPMAAKFPVRAYYELHNALDILFFGNVFNVKEVEEIIDKVLPINDLITATVNKIAAANGPSVSSMKTKVSVEYYATQLVLDLRMSYFIEQVTRRLEAAEQFESDKVEMVRLENEKAKAATETRAEKLAKDVADAEARAKANIEKIKKEAANEARAKAK